MQVYGDLAYIGGGDGGDTTPKGRAAASLSLATPGGPGYTYLHYNPIRYDELSELSLTEYVANSDGYYSIHMTLLTLDVVELSLGSWIAEIIKNSTEIIASKPFYKIQGLSFGIGVVDCAIVERLNATDTISCRLFFDGISSYSLISAETARYADFFRL